MMQTDDAANGRKNLQELYFHLEHTTFGNRNMAFYGQLRAEGKDHKEALGETIEYFRLTTYDWYQSRLKYKAEQDAKKAEYEKVLEARRKQNEQTPKKKWAEAKDMPIVDTDNLPRH